MSAAPLPTRVNILNTAAELTSGDRDIDYGPPIVNLTAAGALKDTFRRHLRRPMSVGELEAIDMVLSKLGRIATGKIKADNYIDGAAYFAIAGEIAEIGARAEAAEQERNKISESNGGKGISAEEMARRLSEGATEEDSSSGV